MKPHLQYAWYLARHKWFVFLAGLKTGAPLWRLVVHDWSKVSPAEWTPYVRSFYGPQPRTDEVKAAFNRAWLHHQHRNPHHWQHHLVVSGTLAASHPATGLCECLPQNASSSADAADSDVHNESLSMEDESDTCVLSTTLSTALSSTASTWKKNEPGTEPIMPKIGKRTALGCASLRREPADRFLFTMEATRQAASAAGRVIMSSLRWTMLMVGETLGVKKKLGGWAESAPTAGLFATAFRQILGSYATTVIHPLGTTGIVLIKQTFLLQNDDGRLRCLRCGRRPELNLHDIQPLEVPNHFVREMVADWMGAGRAITGKWDAPAWYLKNKDKIQLSTSTRMYVEYLLGLRKQKQED